MSDGTAYGEPFTELMAAAERELAAFVRAVTELFGAEQAHASAEDWLRELSASEEIPATPRQWRTLTIAAAARLARRVNFQGDNA